MSPVLLLWLVAAFQAGTVEGATVVARDGELSAPLFSFERTVTTSDDRTVAAVRFLDPTGRVVATERVTYVGGDVVEATLEQRQVDERHTMTVSDGDAWFEAVRDGKTSRTRREWTPDTLTIDQLPSFVTSQWGRLLEGEAVGFRLVALDRARIVRFRVTHRGQTEHLGRPAAALRLEANSMFVRWLAPEVDLVFSADGQTMLESRGPLPVKVRDGGEWVDLDARLVWDR